MHTLYDVKTDIPSFFLITNADLHDSKVMNEIPYEPDDLSSSSPMISHRFVSQNRLSSQIRCKVKTFSTISSINSQKLLLFAANLRK